MKIFVTFPRHTDIYNQHLHQLVTCLKNSKKYKGATIFSHLSQMVSVSAERPVPRIAKDGIMFGNKEEPGKQTEITPDSCKKKESISWVLITPRQNSNLNLRIP